MRGLLLPFSMVPLALALLATSASAQEEAAPQNDWMVHMDKSTGAWRYIPEQPVLVPGGLVQLMVFGDGQFSIVLDDDAETAADIASERGTVRTAELRAPLAPGEYPFHDKYHPEARGVLLVRERAAAQPSTGAAGHVIGVVPGGYEATFAPARLEVPAGATVTFRANGTFGHNLQATNGSFSAGDLAPGESATFTAPSAPGTYAFECRFHAGQGMVGTLVVTSAPSPAASAPAPSSPAPTTPDASPARETAGVTLGGALLTIGLCALVVATSRRDR